MDHEAAAAEAEALVGLTTEVGMWLIGGGILGLVASAALTQSFLRSSGRSADSFPQAAGKGIVPSWVSLVNLGSWALIALGVFRILIN